MVSSLSSLIDNLTEALHKDKCEKSKFCLEYTKFKNDLLIFKCLDCNENY